MKTVSFDESVWQVVPRVPTDAMLLACPRVEEERDVAGAWAAMLAAAPAIPAAPPAQQQSQPPRSIIITLRQARELVELFGGADSEVVVTKREAGEIQPDRREDRGLCPEDGLSSHAQGTGSRSSDRP